MSPTPIWHRSWYLDTSLLIDFVDRNVRHAHETAVPHDGHTILRVQGTHSAAWVPVITTSGRRLQFELNRTIDLLRAIHFSHGTAFCFSELTKAEIIRRLRRSHSTYDPELVSEWWKSLQFLLVDYRQVDFEFPTPSDLSDLALKVPLGKNVQDYLHLMLARANELEFVTLDKFDSQIPLLRSNYYSQIHYWPELMHQVPLAEPFDHLLKPHDSRDG